jgi:nucleotide-binding universal stress UspA family protein
MRREPMVPKAPPAGVFMLQPQRILLASHGTPGARAAESAALLLAKPGATLFHLTVVPDFWRGMMGDDWLNNVTTREAYCSHLEKELGREIERYRQELEPKVLATGAIYRARIVLGKPAECLLAHAAETDPQIVVIGSPRGRSMPGLSSRMQMELLIRRLAAPLLVVPHPR